MPEQLRVRIKSVTKSTEKPLSAESSMPRQLLSKFSDYIQFIGSRENSHNIYTVTKDYAPSWYGASDYIIHGYRRPTYTFAGCVLSLLYLHNESMNVYTHLFGFILSLNYSFSFYTSTLLPTTVVHDYMAHGAFFAGLLICLGCSTLFHLCCCHSRKVSIFINKADYLGIVTLIVGSFIPVLYYGFYCDYGYKMFYMCSIVFLGIVTTYITVHPKYTAFDYRWLRISLFVALGLSGVIPVTHLVARYGFNMATKVGGIEYIIGEGILYIGGAVIYGFRIPEKWFPDGRFDIWGHSHQIWHVFVLAAAFCHYVGVMKVYYWWHEHNPVCLHSDAQMLAWFQ